MKIKAGIIAILLVVNLGLMASVVLSVFDGGQAWAGTAQGQILPGGSKYVMVTGGSRREEQFVYILNLESRLLGVFTFDTGRKEKRLSYSGRADFTADFR